METRGGLAHYHPALWLTTVRLGRRIRETARKQRQREGAMATIASESIGSIRAIKSLGLEAKFAGDFDRKNNQSQTDDLKASRLSLQLGRTVDILLAISTAGVLWLGAHLFCAERCSQVISSFSCLLEAFIQTGTGVRQVHSSNRESDCSRRTSNQYSRNTGGVQSRHRAQRSARHY